VTEDRYVSAPRVFAAADPVFPGHFPATPIVPGALLLDAVIETAGEMLGDAAAVVGIDRVKFLRPLRPDEAFHIELCARGDTALDFTCVSRGTTIATGSVRFDADRKE
jgi:3-hydroxyacyl-[acyl-carrier-protein] dehydratase